MPRYPAVRRPPVRSSRMQGGPTAVLIAAAAAVLAGLLAFRRRPVKSPPSQGSWEPLER